MQAEEDEQRLSEAQQAAEDEAALRAMREEGMLSDQPTSSQPQPGKAWSCHPPPPPPPPQSAGRLRASSDLFSTELSVMCCLSFILRFLSLPQVQQIKQSADLSSPINRQN